MGKPALKIVPEKREQQPDLTYEAEQRRHIMSRDWAGLHVWSDRNPPLPFYGFARRLWR